MTMKMDEWGNPQYLNLDYWGNTLYLGVTEYGTFVFGDLIQYLTTEVVTGTDTNGALDISLIKLEDVYIREVMWKVISPITISEMINIIGGFSNSVQVALMLETLNLENTILKTVSLIKSDILRVYQISTHMNLMENGYAVFPNMLTENGRFTFNVLDESGYYNFGLDTINGLASIIIDVDKNESITIGDTVSKRANLIKTELINIGSTIRATVRHTLTDLFNVSSGITKAVETPLVDEIYLDSTIPHRETTTTITNILELVQIFNYWTEWVMTEVLNISHVPVSVTASARLTDVVRLAKDTIPIDPFHDHRINVSVAYNTLSLEVLNSIDTLIKHPSPYKSETILFNNTLTKNPSIVKSEILRLWERELAGVKKVITKSPFAEQLTISVNALKTISSKYLTETLYFTNLLTHPFFHYLIESISIIGTIPQRSLSTTVSEEVILMDTILRGQVYQLIAEILNVSAGLDPLSLRVYLSEKLNIIASFQKQLLSWMYEQITVIEAGKTVSRLTRNLIEHGETMFGALTDSAQTVFSDLDESGYWKLHYVVSEKPITYISIFKSEALNVLDTKSLNGSKALLESINIMRAVVSHRVTAYKTETINVIDDVYNMFGVLLLEVVYLSDSLVKRPAPYILEKIVVYDDLISVYGILLEEILTIGDDIISRPMKVFLEVINLPDTLQKTIATQFTELIKFRQTLTKRPMTYRTLEVFSLSSAFRVSLLITLTTEAVTIGSTLDRMLSVYLIDMIKLADARCAKRISFVAHESLAVIDLRYATLDRTLQEIIVLPDRITLSVVVDKLEALLVSTTIAKGIQMVAFNEMITLIEVGKNVSRTTLALTEYGAFVIGDTLTELGSIVRNDQTEIGKWIIHVVTYESPLIYVNKKVSDSLSIGDLSSKSITFKLINELISLRGRATKILHAYTLSLEVINISDTRTWYNNLVHRLESVVRQVTSIRSASRTDKEKSAKKLTKDTKRE